VKYSLLFLPEVEDDALNGFTWYEQKSRGLGEEFLRMFYARAEEISRNPLIYQTIYKDFRRCLLNRFPYAIYFQIDKQNIFVYGLFHCARNPKAIKKNLLKR
tara:strand:+ start:755 stop:1060 length:306 start_codon:yes stop_codon:yes gene_type:complete